MPCIVFKALCKADLFNAKVNSEDFFSYISELFSYP